MKSNVYRNLELFFENNPVAYIDTEEADCRQTPCLIAIAKYFGYSAANIAILEADVNDAETFRAQHTDTYENLLTCTHHRDDRTLLEYGQDLVASWVFEDYFHHYLNNSGIQVTLNGKDKNREILEGSNVNADSDYVLSLEGHEAYLELVNDYKGYWARNHKCDLRDSKWNHLCQIARGNRPSLLLGLDFAGNKYFLKNTKDPQDVIYIPSHWPYGGKPAYSIALKNSLRDFTFDDLIASIRGELVGA